MKLKSILLFLLSISINLFAQFSPSQCYSISSRSTGRFLTAATDLGGKFNYTSTNGDWLLIDNGDGTYKIQNNTTGQVLGVLNSSIAENASIRSQAWTGANAQKWIISGSNGYYTIKNFNSNLLLSAINELPTTPDPNPDIAYYDSFSSLGTCVQQTGASLETQQFHIAPIYNNPIECLTTSQLGWTPLMDKKAILFLNTNIPNPSFQLKSKLDNSVVYSGTMTQIPGSPFWGQYYYQADLTAYSTEGEYTLECNGFSAPVTIRTTAYLDIKNAKGTTLKYPELLNGFWKYNRYYPATQTIDNASMTLVSGVANFTLNGTFNIEPNGWFDAHSRDSKVGRTAKVVSDFCLAYQKTVDPTNKNALETEIRMGLQHLLSIQNTDYSWPNGKVREDVLPRKLYYWTTNVDVNTCARVVKSLALGYQIFKNSDPTLASTLLTAAQNGWTYVTANESLVDANLDISWRGHSVDILAAAIEMAYATNTSTYFDKADLMINEGSYVTGIFKKTTGTLPCESGNRYTELDNGTLVSICRYYAIARTQAIKDQIQSLITQFMSTWNVSTEAYGFPRHPLDRTTAYGNVVQVARMAYNMFAIAEYLSNTEAHNISMNAFHFLVGMNPYKTSYIVGIGDSTITPSMAFFKRSFEDGIGSILPGFTTDAITGQFTQAFDTYESTEGVAPSSSMIFYMLSRINEMYNPQTIQGPTQSPYNGDFEQGVNTGWTLSTGQSATASYTNAETMHLKAGSNSAKITINTLPTASYNNVKITSSKAKLVPGDNLLDLSVWGKSLSGTGGFKLAVNFYDSNSTKLATNTSGVLALNSGYQQHNVQFIIPTNSDSISVELRCGFAMDTYFFDDLEIPDVANITTISDKNEKSVIVYPNPATDYIVIKGIDLEHISLYNLKGTEKKVSFDNNIVNIEEFEEGFYLLKIVSKDGSIYYNRVLIQ